MSIYKFGKDRDNIHTCLAEKQNQSIYVNIAQSPGWKKSDSARKTFKINAILTRRLGVGVSSCVDRSFAPTRSPIAGTCQIETE